MSLIPTSNDRQESALAQQTRDMQLLIGRVLIGGAFIVSGAEKLINVDAYTALLAQFTQAMLWISMTATIELVAGLAILSGFKLRIASLALFIWFLPVTFVIHNPSHAEQFLYFIKNLIILGAFQLLMIIGPGRFSLDAFLGEDK